MYLQQLRCLLKRCEWRQDEVRQGKELAKGRRDAQVSGQAEAERVDTGVAILPAFIQDREGSSEGFYENMALHHVKLQFKMPSSIYDALHAPPAD